jgi:hypothetical protein
MSNLLYVISALFALLLFWIPTTSAFETECGKNYSTAFSKCFQDYDESVTKYKDRHCCLTAKFKWCFETTTMQGCENDPIATTLIKKAQNITEEGFKEKKCIGRKRKTSPLCWFFYSRHYWIWGSISLALLFVGSCVCCLWKCLCCRKIFFCC